MTTPSPTFDSALSLVTSGRAIARRSRQANLLVLGAITLVATALVLVQLPTAAALVCLAGLAVAGASLIQAGLDEADTVILVGRSPMASIIASSITLPAAGSTLRGGSALPGRGRRPMTVLRAAHLAEAAALARTARCDEVIDAGSLALASAVGGADVDAIVDARGVRPTVVSGPEKVEQLLGRIPVELALQDRLLTRIAAVRPLAPGYAALKRGLDITAALGIGLFLLPALPLIAVAIALDSRGPMFYSQVRVGLGGKPFQIYKFRTMRTDAERHGAVWATAADPRVTRLGRIMRKTRIDELPQLWNVLRGDMTLVGPRPERPEFTATLAREIHGYHVRHTVKPGLTGWAQVCYRYTSSIRDTKAKVEYDLFYVKHCSPAFDLKILLRTVKVVVGMKGQ